MPRWVYVLALVITVGVILCFTPPNQYAPVKSPDSVPEVEAPIVEVEEAIEADPAQSNPAQVQVPIPAQVQQPIPQEEQSNEPTVGKVQVYVSHKGSNDPVTFYQLKSVHSGMEDSVQEHTVRSPHGRFDILPNIGKLLTIYVSGEGYTSAQAEVKGGIGIQRIHSILLELEGGAVVEGVVVDPWGKPLEGARIFIEANGAPLKEQESSRATTRSDGRFRMIHLSELSMRIYARHYAFQPGWTDVFSTFEDTTQIQIMMNEGGVIEGAVLESGEPLVGMGIYADGEDTNGTGVGTTDADGRYLINNLASGFYTVNLSLNDHRRKLSFEAEVAKGMVTEVNFIFDEYDNEMSGLVTVNGVPADGAEVVIEMHTDVGIEEFRILFDRSDEYLFSNLPAGEATVTVSGYMMDSTFANGTMANETFTLTIGEGMNEYDFDLESEE